MEDEPYNDYDEAEQSDAYFTGREHARDGLARSTDYVPGTGEFTAYHRGYTYAQRVVA